MTRQDLSKTEVELIDFRALWGIALRQYKVILATSLSLALLAVVTIGLITPRYTSQALLLIDPRQSHLVNIAGVMSGLPANSAKVDSEVEILKSSRVAIEVIKSLGLEENAGFLTTPSVFDRLAQFVWPSSPQNFPASEDKLTLLKTLDSFGKELEVKRRGLTYIVEISYTSTNSDLATKIANRIAEVYLELQTEAKREVNQRAVGLLKERLAALTEQLQTSEVAVESFMEQQVELALTNAAPQKFEQALKNWQKHRNDTEQLAALFEKVRTSHSNGNHQSAALLLNSTSLDNLIAHQKVLEAKETSLRSQPNFAEAVLFTLQNELRQTNSLFREEVASQVEDLRLRVAEAKEGGMTAKEVVRDVVAANHDQNGPALELWKLQQNSEATRVLYETFLSRLRQTEQLQSVQFADSRIISAALPTLRPSFPPASLILVIIGFVSVGVGLGVGVLRDRFAENIHEEDQLEQAMKIPVMTGIPNLPRSSTASARGAFDPSLVNMIIDQPVSAFSDSIRGTRIGLELAAEDVSAIGLRKALCVMVASAAPGEGKSTLAILLARSWSQAGKKVALLDFDFRRPTIHALLEGANDNAAMGSDKLDLDQTNGTNSSGFLSDPKSSMKYVHARNWLKSPDAEFGISSAEITRIIDDLKRRFDVVLIDTPALLPIADARLVLPSADITLFVARASSSTYTRVLRALRDVQQFEKPVVAVLNGVKKSENYAKEYRSSVVAPQPAATG